MDLKNTVITDILSSYTVFSVKGRYDEMRSRKSYGLSFCVGGQITYIQNGREYVSNPGVAVILPKHGNYIIRGDKTGSFPLINFDCKEPLCETVTPIPIENADELIAEYKRIEKLFYSDENHAQIFSIFYEIIHRLSAGRIPYELRDALKYIKTAYKDPHVTNLSIAEASGISEVYLRKLFAKHFKSSPKQFVVDFRMQKAKQLLAEGFMNIASISDDCGFSNPYHFARAFKKHAGMTPSEYRKKNIICKI